MWSSIAYTGEGFVVAGSNNFERGSLSISHYDKNGKKVFFWDEPISKELDIVEEILLIEATPGEVVLAVTGDTGWKREGRRPSSGTPLYKTHLKHLPYLSP